MRSPEELKLVKHAMKGIRVRNRQDVAAEGLLALVEGRQRGEEGDELLRTVQHACRRAARREWTNDNRTAYTIPDAGCDRSFAAYARMWDAVEALPGRQREAVLLVYWEGLSQSEAAARMECNQATVSRLLSASLEEIQTFLGKRA